MKQFVQNSLLNLGILNFLSVSFDAQKTSRIVLLYVQWNFIYILLYLDSGHPLMLEIGILLDDVIYFFVIFWAEAAISSVTQR